MDPTSNSTTRDFQVVEQYLNRFLEAWEAEPGPPALSEFLPPADTPERHAVLVELIKLDMEYRQERGLACRLENYLENYGADFPHGPPTVLIFEEFHLRKRAGEAVVAAEYLDRFPIRATELRRFFEGGMAGAAGTAGGNFANAFQPGDTIQDFRLLLSLGQGSFGAVFLAHQTSMNRMVALKITNDLGTEPQTLAQLNHEHIVRVFDLREIEGHDLRLMYMEYVPGGTLRDVVTRVAETAPERRSGKLMADVVREALQQAGQAAHSPRLAELEAASWPELVCRVGIQLASALRYAHQEQGVLHRDIKPANVLLSSDGAPKLADFNISYCSKFEGTTARDRFGGSLSYMAPEQLEAFDSSHPRTAEELNAQIDIYSLGVMLWELLFGKRPFSEPATNDLREKVGAMIRERRLTSPQRPADSPAASASPPAGLEEAVIDVLRRCLSPELDVRYRDAGEVVDALRLCLHPRARRLVSAAPAGWTTLASRCSLGVLLATVVAPNLLAAFLNLWYNDGALMSGMAPEIQRVFYQLVGIINGIAFPVGMLLVAHRFWPVRTALVVSSDSSPASTDVIHRALGIGHFASLVGIVEWTLAGLVYPSMIHLLTGTFPLQGYPHFVISLIGFGAMAASYPFFAATLLVLRAFVPRLLPRPRLGARELDGVRRIGRLSFLYLVLAAVSPLLSLLVLAPMALWGWWGDEVVNKLALLWTIVTGLGGLGIAFTAHRAVQLDIAALEAAFGTPRG